MSVEDPRTYQRYEENAEYAARRLEFAINIERLQDDMRRVKKELSFEAMARLIPEIVSQHAPEFPDGGNISTQNLYDFLRLRSPSIPTQKRRLAYHAFMMVVDDSYREKWDHTHFVRRAGLALTDFLATNREADRYTHAASLQRSVGLYRYALEDALAWPGHTKQAFEMRCLLLSAAADLPFLLAYDFDVQDTGSAPDDMPPDLVERYWSHVQASWDLDARVGFFIPKRSAIEGILMLNSFKWDWPTVYAAIANYVAQEQVDERPGEVMDILLTDVNSWMNIERTERSYFDSDHEAPDNRKIKASRLPTSDQPLSKIASLLTHKFDWGVDL